MRKVVLFFIKNGKIVNLFILLFFIFGFITVTKLNSSFFPKLPDLFININAVYPGSSPSEVEEGITLKIEENLKSVSGLEKFTSVSSENTCNIIVEIKQDQDINLLLQEVKNAVDQVSNFPSGMEKIQVFKREQLNRTAFVVLTGNTSLRNLKLAAEQFEEDLRAYPELSQMSISGYTSEEIEIQVSENKLRAYNLTLDEISEAIKKSNVRVSGGTLKGDIEFKIRVDNKKYNAHQLRDIVLRVSSDGTLLKLGDVSEINEAWSEDTNLVLYNGQRSIRFEISTLNSEDILKAAKFVHKKIDDFNESNKTIKAIMYDDRTTILNDRIDLLLNNGTIGLMLVVVLLGLFLRVRLSLWVALGIPISFLGMIMMAFVFGITINALSLFGMILVIGILVDDGIVVAENVFQKYEGGMPPIKAAVEGTLEVFPSVFSAITTTSVAFSLFFFIEGRLGDFFSDIAFVVIWALLFSLIEVMLFLPMHLAYCKDMRLDYKTPKIKAKIESVLFWFRDNLFLKILKFALTYKIFFFCLCMSLLLLSFACLKWRVVRSTFFPEIEARSLSVSIETPSGSSQQVTAKAISHISDAVERLNKRYVEDANVGKPMIETSLVLYGSNSNEAKGIFMLPLSENRTLKATEILADFRDEVGFVHGVDKLSYDNNTPFGKPINVSLSSGDNESLVLAVNDFVKELSKAGMFVEINTNASTKMPEVEIKLKKQALLLGLSEQYIMRQIRSGFFGNEAQKLQRGNDEVKVWVRYLKEDRNQLDDLYQMRINVGDSTIPLSELVTIENNYSERSINHRNGSREITITADIDVKKGYTSTEGIPYVDGVIIPKILKKYPNTRVSFGGQQRLRDKTFGSIKSAGGIVLIIMLSLLIISFNSYSQAFALAVIVPFGLVGAIFGHWLHGHAVSLLSMLGFIALTGVILNDGIVFVNTFNRYLKEGVLFNEALLETAKNRFRPIILTTLTTSIGLLPLILEKSFQAQFLIPMAITIAYGLLAGSFFVTVLLPLTLTLFNRIKIYGTYLWEGKKPSKEEVESAVIQLKDHASISE